jgi:hypothetical protein
LNTVKEEAKTLIEALPDRVTWEDVMYEIYVCQKLAAATKAADEGRIVSHAEIKREFSPK